MVHHSHKALLEPFAVFWSACRDERAKRDHPAYERLGDFQAHWFYTAMMEPMTKREVERLARACAAHTSSNCWFAAFRVVRDPEFLKVLNADGVVLHWANDVCHFPGKKACAQAGCPPSAEGGKE